jgi:hypothetical protein
VFCVPDRDSERYQYRLDVSAEVTFILREDVPVQSSGEHDEQVRDPIELNAMRNAVIGLQGVPLAFNLVKLLGSPV